VPGHRGRITERGQQPVPRGTGIAKVSWVVKVFDEITNSVSAGSRSRVASAKSVPSMFETNRKVSRRSDSARSAS